MGTSLAFAYSSERNINGEIRRAVGEGHTFADGRHRRRAWRGAIAESFARIPFFERILDLCGRFGLEEYFGGAAPDHDEAVGFAFLLKLRMSFAKLFGESSNLFLAFLTLEPERFLT